MLSLPILLIPCLGLFPSLSSCDTVSVTLRNGDILEGFKVTSNTSATGNVFLGVPYAQPPIGSLRFKKTRPLDNFQTSRISCLDYKPSCWQNHTRNGKPFLNISKMSEDCLYLNVYMGTNCTEDTPCPVLYYVHGGAFEYGSPSEFPIDLLVENFANQGLVLVTVTYRLGVLGWWSIGNEEAMGNYAMYDVIEGLKWVQHEISAFGGDRNRVTVMGHSSGATMVSLLTLTTHTSGLFHAAIVMSSSPELSTDLSQYRRLAEDVGCSSSDRPDKPSAIVECMRDISPKQLIDLYKEYQDTPGPDQAEFTKPLVDGPGGLFPAPVEELRKSRRRMDLMIGTTSREMGPRDIDITNASARTVAQLCEKKIDELSVNKNRKLLIFECQRLYIDLENDWTEQAGPDNIWNSKIWQFTSDVQYFAPVFQEAASLADRGAKVYLYSFDYVKKGLEGVAPWHAFDLTYVMGIHPFEFDDRDRAIKSIYISLFINFAKYKNPTAHKCEECSDVTWDPLENLPLDMGYFSVDVPEPKMKKGYHYQSVIFWNYVVPNVGNVNEDQSRRFQRVLQVNHPEEMDIKNEVKGVGWREAFWLTFSVALLILFISILAFTYRQRYWRCSNYVCDGRMRKAQEKKAILGNRKMRRAYSYSTF